MRREERMEESQIISPRSLLPVITPARQRIISPWRMSSLRSPLPPALSARSLLVDALRNALNARFVRHKALPAFLSLWHQLQLLCEGRKGAGEVTHFLACLSIGRSAGSRRRPQWQMRKCPAVGNNKRRRFWDGLMVVRLYLVPQKRKREGGEGRAREEEAGKRLLGFPPSLTCRHSCRRPCLIIMFLSLSLSL